MTSTNFIITLSKIPTMTDITLEKLAKDIEHLKPKEQIMSKLRVVIVSTFKGWELRKVKCGSKILKPQQNLFD